MSEREPIGKTLRFEVFKRDHFTCQYCGQKAPDVVLHCDHINPVAEGGKSDILNLVTACAGCNAGKGARLLDDKSIVQKQQGQLEELQERREQLEMILAWRDELDRFQADTVEIISARIVDRTKIGLNENGKASLRRWLMKFSTDEILHAIVTAFDVYGEYLNEEMTEASWEKAFAKIPAIASVKRQSADKPYLPRLFYIQGILRRRFRDKYGKYVTALQQCFDQGIGVDEMEEIAKRSSDWDEFCASVDEWLVQDGPH